MRITQKKESTLNDRIDQNTTTHECVYRHVFEGIPEPLLLLDDNIPPRVRSCNRAMEELVGFKRIDLCGSTLSEIFGEHAASSVFQEKLNAFAFSGYDLEVPDITLNCAGGDVVMVDIRVFPVKNAIGDRIGWLYILRSHSRRLHLHESLLHERRKLEHARAAVESKNEALERVLHEMEREKDRVSSQMRSNMSKTILPLISLLRERQLPEDRVYVDLLESNLRDISSSFSTHLEAKHPRLSPRETDICKMILAGFATKEIARILKVSERTVGTQRNRIRKKLGLINSDINLLSYLRSLDTTE